MRLQCSTRRRSLFSAIFPAAFDIHWALATMLRDQGNNAAAREIAEGLAVRHPDVPPIQKFLESP